jgi:hypothetical protein
MGGRATVAEFDKTAGQLATDNLLVELGDNSSVYGEVEGLVDGRADSPL